MPQIVLIPQTLRNELRQRTADAIAAALAASGAPLPIAAIVDLAAGAILDGLGESGWLAPPPVRVDAGTIEIVDVQEGVDVDAHGRPFGD